MVKDEIYSKSIIEYFYDFDIFNPTMYLHDIVNIKDIKYIRYIYFRKISLSIKISFHIIITYIPYYSRVTQFNYPCWQFGYVHLHVQV